MSIAQDRLPRAVIARRGPSGIVNLTRATQNAVSRRTLPLVVQWSFLLFIASIGCEVSSLTHLFGVLFFAIYFLYHNPLARERSFPPIPRATIWFVIYVAVYALNGLFLSSEYLREFLVRLFTLVQSIIFLWIASDILKDEKMTKRALLVYSIASVILALGLVLSLPGFEVQGEVGVERAAATGMNPYALTLAVVALLGLWLTLSHKRLVESVLMFGSMFAVSVALIYTGFRGGLVSLVVGLSVYLIPYWKERWRMSSVIVALFAMAGVAYIVITTPVFYERWQEFSEEGTTGDTRDMIYTRAPEMIYERPLLGWGPVEFRYELGYRTGIPRQRDAHNLYLHLFMEVGVAGAVPFLIGLWMCGKGAWKARNGNLGLLPVALFVALLAGGMSGTTIYLKAQWFVLAVAVAAGVERKRPGVIVVGRRADNGMPTLNSSTPGKLTDSAG